MGQRLRIDISPQFCILAAIMLLLLPLPWLMGWGLAVVLHELSHCAMLCFCAVPIRGIYLGNHGVLIQTDAMPPWKTVISSLAGPLGGLLLLLTGKLFPQAAVCALLLSVYNLLPVYPLDGGRAFQAFTDGIFGEKASICICNLVELLVLSAILMLGLLAAFFWKLGLMPLLLAVILCLRLGKIKIPCKSTLNAVQ